MKSFLPYLTIPGVILLAIFIGRFLQGLVLPATLPPVAVISLPASLTSVQSRAVQEEPESLRHEAFLARGFNAPSKRQGDGKKDDGVRDQPVDATRYSLTGIVVDADQRFAVVDGNVLAVGDVLDDFVVLRIEPDTVWLSGPGEPLILMFE